MTLLIAQDDLLVTKAPASGEVKRGFQRFFCAV
jgi:hypothetical protein